MMGKVSKNMLILGMAAIIALPVSSFSLFDQVKSFFSFNLSEKIFDTINAEIKGSISAQKIRYIVPNKIEIDGIEVADQAGKRVLYAPRVSLALSLPSLLTSNYIISEAIVESPFFRYIITNEVHNVIDLFESKAPSKESGKKSQTRVTIANVTVKNGHFEMEHDAGVTIFADGIEAGGRFWVEDGPFSVDLHAANINHGSIAVDEMELPLSSIVASGLLISDQKVFTKKLTASYGKSLITGTGTVFINEDRYDISAHIDAPENTYPQGLKKLPFVVPRFSSDVVILGHLEDPKINASTRFGPMDFLGVLIDSGFLKATITRRAVKVADAHLNLGKGSIDAQGSVDLLSGSYHFSSRQQNIAAEAIATLASFKGKVGGTIDAQTQVSGNIFTKDDEFNFITRGQVKRLAIGDISVDEKSRFALDFSYIVDKRVELRKAVFSDDLGLQASFYGAADINPPRYHFNYDIKAPKLTPYLRDAVLKFETKNLHATGLLHGDQQQLATKGAVRLESLQYEKYLLTNAKADFTYDGHQIDLTNIASKFLDGELTGDVAIKDVGKSNVLLGELMLSKGLLGKPLVTDKLAGIFNARVKLMGPAASLRADFDIDVDRFMIDRMKFDRVELSGTLLGDQVTIADIDSSGVFGSFSGRNISVDLANHIVKGQILLENIELENALGVYTTGVSGKVRGPVDFVGKFDAVEVSATLAATDVNAFGQYLGSGPVALQFGRKKVNGKTEDVLATSVGLKTAQGVLEARVSWAIKEQIINAEARLLGINIDTRKFPWLKNYVSLQGEVDGEITASGPIKSPEVAIRVHLPGYAFVNNVVEQDDSKLVVRGPAQLELNLSKGTLTASGCLSLDVARKTNSCATAKGIAFRVDGPFHRDRFALKTTIELDHKHVQEAFYGLRSEFTRLDTAMKLEGELIKSERSDVQFFGGLSVARLFMALPNIPSIELEQPVYIAIKNDVMSLREDAILNFSPGSLRIAGSLSAQKILLSLNGTIPLTLTRFLVPIIQRAEGLASGYLQIEGTLTRPLFFGSITPQPASLITFNKYFEPLEFKKGSISFETISHGFATALEDIDVSLGDGRLLVDGVINRTYEHAGQPGATTFELNLDGSNVILREDNDYVEADFKISTVKEASGAPIAKGRVVITDGRIHRKFDLRNFVAQAERRSTTSAQVSFDSIDTAMEIDVLVRQLNASARMLNLEVDSTLSGQLYASGMISNPKVFGILSVDEGYIKFPAATMDLAESRIEFDEQSPTINPKISITAIKELEKDLFLGLNQDTTIELTLKGDKDRLSLEFRPISGDMRLSQTKIFLLLLLPQGFSEEGTADQIENIKQGAQRAAMALSGEVFLRPLTNELQDIIEAKTNTRIQFGSSLAPSGVTLKLNWKMGPRIEWQGSYMFITDEARARDQGESELAFDSFYPLGDIKVKLLLFDHRPFGPLFLESSLGANWQRDSDVSLPFGMVRLKYRAVSK